MVQAVQIGGVPIGVSDNGDGTWALRVRQTLTVKEVDGSPSVSNVSVIKFPNGTLTDNGDGSVTYTAAGGGTPTALSGAGGTVNADAAAGPTVTPAAGKSLVVVTNGTGTGPYVSLKGTAGDGVGIDFSSSVNAVHFANIFADESDLLIHRYQADGVNRAVQLDLSFDGSWYIENRVASADITVNAGGDVLFSPTATTGKHGFFRSAGAVQATAASITDLAALKTYMTALGLLS